MVSHKLIHRVVGTCKVGVRGIRVIALANGLYLVHYFVPVGNNAVFFFDFHAPFFTQHGVGFHKSRETEISVLWHTSANCYTVVIVGKVAFFVLFVSYGLQTVFPISGKEQVGEY